MVDPLYKADYVTQLVRKAKIMKKNPYEILGVSPNSSDEEIKKAYKAKCFEFHPDRFATESPEKQKEMETKFKEVQEAHQAIQNGSNEEVNNDFGSVGDFFSTFFNNFRANRKSQEVPTYNVEIEEPIILSFKESILGCSRYVEFDFTCKCFVCSGHGEIPSSKPCKTCNGSGSVSTSHQKKNFFFKEETPCANCLGTGKILEKCTTCKNTGKQVIQFKESLEFEPNGPVSKRIEKQVIGGKIIFIIKVQTKLPDGFAVGIRNNKQVLTKIIEVQAIDFLLGGEVSLDLEDGEKPIQIEYGINKEKIIVPKKGLPSRGERGDLEVEIRQIFPKQNISEKQRELLNKFKES